MFQDAVLDFDDANEFLSALSGAIPLLDTLPEWGLDFSQPADFDPLLVTANFDLSDADLAAVPDPARTLAMADFAEPRLLSASMYLDLASSHFAASAEHTPVTTILSAHALPDVKKEPEAALVDAELEKVLSRASSIASDDYSPRERAQTKDKVSKPGKKSKVSHNMIEKKYRTNINSKILELRDAVPTLRIATGKHDVRVADLEGLVPASKLNKASVLTKATEYIKHLEQKNKSLSSQILLLQSRINEASMGQAEGSTQDTQGGFGFNPLASFNTTVNDYSAFSGGELAPVQNAQQGSLNSTVFLAGLATLMGGSFITEDTFRGMAAVPFAPQYLFSSSSELASSAALTVRYGIMFLGLATMLLPVYRYVFSPTPDKSTAGPEASVLSWILVTMGLQLPGPLSPLARQNIVDRLLGKLPTSLSQFMRDYVTLTSSELNFENCLLTVLVGVLLVEMHPLSKSYMALTMKWRGNLLMNLDYSGDNANLQSLNKLIKEVDGLCMFESDVFVKRMLNVTKGLPINKNVNNGENGIKYADVLASNQNDLYGLIFGWRVLDIFHELNLKYVDGFVTESDEVIENIQKDTEKLGLLVKGNANLYGTFSLFRSVVSPKSTPCALKNVRDEITSTLAKLHNYTEGQELTDEEIISDSDASITEDDKIGTVDATNSPLEALKRQGSIAYSLNLITEEKFIVLVSSMVSYYMHQKEEKKLLALLHYLRFKQNKVPLSLLSFTCLVKLLSTVMKTEEEKANAEDDGVNVDAHDSIVLESLVKLTRGWLNDDRRMKFMSNQLRSLLLDFVMVKGVALNEI